jgi:hypothetical protein
MIAADTKERAVATLVYNEAYLRILAAKHPRALGQACPETPR